MTNHPDEITPVADDLAISEEAVIKYLRAHPQFFRTNADVLSDMQAPDRWPEGGDGVIDMQRFLLDRRSGEIDELRDCAQEVIETSRSNMSVQTRTHAAVLAALSASDFEHLVRILTDDWPYLLDVDVVTLGFEAPYPSDKRLADAELVRYATGTADAYIGFDNDIVLVRQIHDDGTIFGAGAGLVRSAAIARIHPSRTWSVGVLALGSRGNAFRPGQGTEMINFLVRVVECLLPRMLESAGD